MLLLQDLRRESQANEVALVKKYMGDKMGRLVKRDVQDGGVRQAHVTEWNGWVAMHPGFETKDGLNS